MYSIYVSHEANACQILDNNNHNRKDRKNYSNTFSKSAIKLFLFILNKYSVYLYSWLWLA